MSGLCCCLTALVPDHPVALGLTRDLADHQEALTHPAVAGHEALELVLGDGERQPRHAEPGVAGAHHHAHLLVLDEDVALTPGVEELRLGQDQLGTRSDSSISLVNGHTCDVNIGQ